VARVVITARLVRVARQHGARAFVDKDDVVPAEPVTRPLRVARMLALSHELNEGDRRGRRARPG
jgi:hypothetical protein